MVKGLPPGAKLAWVLEESVLDKRCCSQQQMGGSSTKADESLQWINPSLHQHVLGGR